jgi:hypothetical protein
MKKTAAALLLAGLCLIASNAFAATTDDVKWINQCVQDNKGGASAEVMLKYLHLHEQQDGREGNPLDHAVGKEP